MNRILIVYYTGTGSTGIVAESALNNLKERGIEAEALRLTHSSKDKLSELVHNYDGLILMYAVHAFNAPEPVYEWLDRLESVSAKPAMVISVSGGGEMVSNTACRVTAIKKLTSKGFKVTTEAMAAMPNNWMSPNPDIVSRALLAIAPQKVADWIDAFLSGQPNEVLPVKTIDRVITKVGTLEKHGGRLFGKNIVVGSTCNGCGWCVKNCPAGNIAFQEFSEEQMPVFGKVCHFCLGCVYGCPQKALTPGKLKFAVIKTGYSIKDIKNKESLDLEDPQTLNQVSEALGDKGWEGVKRYLGLTN